MVMPYDNWKTAGLDGLDASNVSTSMTPGQWNIGSGFWGDTGGYQQTADQYRQTYNAPQGGSWSRAAATFGGQDPSGKFSGWRDASGRQVSDLAGFLNMRKQQAQGANFAPNMNKLQGLLDNPSTIAQDPSYQFRLDQGNQAINRSAAAKGMLGSGNVLAELAKYGQGMASQEYGNQFNRLSDLVRQQQNFGLQSGFYSQDPRESPFGVSYY